MLFERRQTHGGCTEPSHTSISGLRKYRKYLTSYCFSRVTMLFILKWLKNSLCHTEILQGIALWVVAVSPTYTKLSKFWNLSTFLQTRWFGKWRISDIKKLKWADYISSLHGREHDLWNIPSSNKPDRCEIHRDIPGSWTSFKHQEWNSNFLLEYKRFKSFCHS